MELREKLRQSRIDKGLTQKQLGELCNPPIAESTIRRYELGKLNPKKETLKKIAIALEIPVHEFMGDIYNDQNTSFVQDLFSILEQPEKLTEDQLPEIIKNLDYVEELRIESESLKEKWAIQEIAKSLKMLKKSGMEEAVRRVEELTHLPRYRKIFLDNPASDSDPE